MCEIEHKRSINSFNAPTRTPLINQLLDLVSSRTPCHCGLISGVTGFSVGEDISHSYEYLPLDRQRLVAQRSDFRVPYEIRVKQQTCTGLNLAIFVKRHFKAKIARNTPAGTMP
ncbi:jg21476 [Pararge aegeria aegeria]|uniref:Jg21476 protein n=1 Tax=Pararge aegeria aegeria TaxID=348720 RepID=A0A8S4RQW4_9NEOP|nr:jg21476 [Pararge aegeria aegeria]